MKTWLVIVSVVAVLLAAGTGVGFWMLTDVKAELTEVKAELTDAKAELTDTEAGLTEIQERLEENFGYWLEPAPWEYPWREGTTGDEYPWCVGIEETVWELEERIEGLEWPIGREVTISDLELRVEELEWAVRDLEQQLQVLERTLQIHGIY